MRPTELSRATGVPQPTVHRILEGTSRDPRSATVQPIADFLGVTLDDLYFRDLSGHPPSEALPKANVREGPSIQGRVPRISSVQAGEWAEIVDNFQPGDAAEWLPCPVKHGPHTFCLVVEGESMRNYGGRPSYEPGDVIFVDPDVGARSGDRVVVRLESQSSATFKQYIEEDGRKMLKALNPDWKPRYLEINGDATVCGVVIGKWVPE